MKPFVAVRTSFESAASPPLSASDPVPLAELSRRRVMGREVQAREALSSHPLLEQGSVQLQLCQEGNPFVSPGTMLVAAPAIAARLTAATVSWQSPEKCAAPQPTVALAARVRDNTLHPN